jgi:antitoxin ParD1/3/4
LREFIDSQVTQAGYGTSSEYVRELVRRDQQRVQLRALLMEGARSPLAGEGDARYFTGLRQRIKAAQSPAARPKPARKR